MSNQAKFDDPAVSRHAQRSVALTLMIFVFMFLFSAVKAAAAASSPAAHFTQAAATSIHTTAGSLSLSFPSTTAAGDVILVAFDYNTKLTVTAVTDSQGNAYSLIGSPITSPGGSISTIYYANKIKGGPDTVTVKLSANSPVIELYLAEYSGLNATSPIDAHVGATGSTSAVSSGTAATTVAGDIIFGYCLGDMACTAGASFATRSTMDGNLIEDMVAGKAGAYAATGSATSTWTMKMVALKPALAPAVSLSSSTLSFSSPAVGTASAAQVVTVSNTGNAALSLSSIALTGANAADFAQTNNCGSSLAAGAKCTISATFKPTATGTRTAAVALTDNATGSPQTVSLTGTSSAAIVSLSPIGLTFASQAVGATSAAQTVTLHNTGNSALSVSSIALAGSNASDFAQTNNCGSLVAVGANCLVSVTFKPAAGGNRTASLRISDNATGSPQTVSLTGTGTAPIASLSPSSLTYGNEPVNITSSPQVVTLNNTGNTALSITSIAFTGTNATDFTQADTCGASVAAGGNCTIAIMFTPSATGTRVASLSITDSASGSPQPVSLSGTGTQTAPTGHTYYVDNCVVTGSDGNNGTSPTTPWLTINKVNTSTFNPGDSILFESTCTWREQLTVPSSGSSGSPITFGAYGTGARPIISGADIFSSWITEGSLYYSSASAQPNQVFSDGVRLTGVAAKASLATGDWWWDSTDSRIYVYDNPSGQTIEASQRNYAINGYENPYWTISGIETDKANVNGLNCTTCNGLFITDVTASWNFTAGVMVSSSTGAEVTQSTAAYNGWSGIDSEWSPGILFDHLVAHDNSNLAMTDNGAGIHLFGTGVDGPATVQYSESYNNGVGQPDYRGLGIWVDTVGSGITIQYNLVYGNNLEGIRAEADTSITILGNVVYDTLGQFGYYTAGIDLAADNASYTMANSLVYGNTVYGISTSNPNQSGINIAGPGIASGCMNNKVQNNISVNNQQFNLSVTGGCDNPGINGSGNVYTYNDFGSTATDFIQWVSGAQYSTYANWETAAGNCGTMGCSHSVQADPQFVNASASQFWLASGSPAIGAGTNLGSPYNIGLLPGSSWPNSVLTGDQNSYGTGWDVGAYIFTGQTVQ